MADLQPINWEDKVNSPELLAYLSQFGEKHYLSAEEINEFKSKINSLLEKTFSDGVLKYGTIQIINGKAFIEEEDFEWFLDKVKYTNPSDYESETIPSATPGHYRTDILVGYAGTIAYVVGPESMSEAPEPEVPEGSVRLGDIPVFGDVISSPVNSDKYVDRTSPQTIYGQKTFKDPLSVYETNVAGVSIYKDMFSVFRFIGAISKYINIKWNEITTTYVIKFPSKPEASVQTFAMVSDVDLKQDTSNQIEVALPATVQNSWHGKTVKFTSSGLLTIPGSFTNSGMTFEGIAKVGVTLNWAITAPKTFEFGNPPPVNGTQFFTFMENEGLNSIMIIGI